MKEKKKQYCKNFLIYFKNFTKKNSLKIFLSVLPFVHVGLTLKSFNSFEEKENSSEPDRTDWQINFYL